MKKQPDKITAYYYRAANKQTDLNLDNQMHRLLSLAQENGTDTYMFFVDNGYSGLTTERPAFQNLLAAIHENRVQKIVVVSLDRLYRSYLAAVQFLDDMEQHRYFGLLHYRRRFAPLPRTVSRHCQRLPQFFRERR